MRKIVFVILLGMIFSCSTPKKTSLVKKTVSKINYIPYYLKVYEADSLYITKNYERSFTILDSLFKKFKPINLPTYYEYVNYVRSAYKTNRLDNPKLKILNLIENFGYSKKYILDDSILKKIYLNVKITDSIYTTYRDRYLSKINFKLRYKLYDLVEEDQFYRTEYNEKDLFKKRLLADLKSQEKLIELFNQNIYPNDKIIGNYSIDQAQNPRVLLLLLHTNDSVRVNYFLPKIKRFIKQGKCLPLYYGLMVDQMQLYHDKNQKYGTFNILSIDEKEIKIFNKARFEIGLPRLEYIIWKSKRQLNLLDK